MPFDCLDNLLRPGADLLFVAPLEHDAKQWLRARIANQQPAVTGEAGGPSGQVEEQHLGVAAADPARGWSY